MALDVAALQRELDALRKERFEARQRLDAMRFGGRPSEPTASGKPGPGWGPGMRPGGDRAGPGPMGRAGSRDLGRGDGPGPSPRGGVFARLGAGGMHAPPPLDRGPSRRLSSGVMADGEGRQPSGSLDRRRSQDLEPAAAPRKRILSSAVAVAVKERGDEEQGGDPRGEEVRTSPTEAAAEPMAGLKRPATAEVEDGGLRKRNRRMFGALLGTLQKFRDEDQQFQSTDTAQRRQEMQRKAEERAREESERLRSAAREQRLQQRQSEIQKLQSVNLAADIKVLEILYAKKIYNKEQRGKFLCTQTGPAVFWQPAEHNDATKRLAEEQADSLNKWKAEMLAELEREKQGLRERAEARQEAAVRMRQQADELRQQKPGDDAGDEAAGEEEGLEAGEYDADEGHGEGAAGKAADAAGKAEEGAGKAGASANGGMHDGDVEASGAQPAEKEEGEAEAEAEGEGEGGHEEGEEAHKVAVEADNVEDLLNA